MFASRAGEMIPDERPQLPNQRELHHCLHVTDGWQRGQTGRINWQDYQGRAILRFSASSAPLLFGFGHSASRFRCHSDAKGLRERSLRWCACFVKVI